jgi:hypothetical protein
MNINIKLKIKFKRIYLLLILIISFKLNFCEIFIKINKIFNIRIKKFEEIY